MGGRHRQAPHTSNASNVASNVAIRRSARGATRERINYAKMMAAAADDDDDGDEMYPYVDPKADDEGRGAAAHSDSGLAKGARVGGLSADATVQPRVGV